MRKLADALLARRRALPAGACAADLDGAADVLQALGDFIERNAP